MREPLKVSRHFEAPPERVFDAWLDPKVAGRFLFATDTGQMLVAEIDAQAGGSFLFTERRPGEGDVEHRGEYLEITRPSRLVFTFGVPRYSPQFTQVTLEIIPAGEGCDLTLTHEGVLEDYRAQTKDGWTMILESLARTLGA